MFGTSAARRRVEERVPGLRMVSASWLSLFAYPLSGGFKRWTLIPEPIGRRLLELEKIVEAELERWFGFRTMIVLQKK